MANRTSTQNLRKRVRYHYRGNAAGSTLRLTLGCLLGLDLRRVGSGKRTRRTSPPPLSSENAGHQDPRQDPGQEEVEIVFMPPTCADGVDRGRFRAWGPCRVLSCRGCLAECAVRPVSWPARLPGPVPGPRGGAGSG
ncbi:GIY-YIG nuclease family protein [Streptomyces sp. NPDC005859]|uniref:GIY-YIG nuclease family protein n=1 Tax=Streptomyces sp. NPDC005859 TaxID=3157170 RepID=UPI003408582C